MGHQGLVQKGPKRALLGDLFCPRTQLVRTTYRTLYRSTVKSFIVPSQSLTPCPPPARHRRLSVYPKGGHGTNADGSVVLGDGFLSVYLQVPAAHARTLPSGWSQHAQFTFTVVSQTNEKCNVKRGQRTSRTFDARRRGLGYMKVLTLATLHDTSKGYIVNDTLIIQCDMTNISSNAPTAAAAAPAAPQLTQRETRIVDADTAAAAVIAAAYPGALPIIAAALPAVAAAAAASDPGAVTGAAPRVAVPAGLYPTGVGGLLYLPPGALANY